jgi:hypothetical protein
MEAHREVKELRSSGFSGDEIKHDISMMEHEIETLTKRTERMRSKSKGFPKFQEMLAAARDTIALVHTRSLSLLMV